MTEQTLFSAADHQYMQQALQLAAQGCFTTAPNPNVGCVIVKEGQVIGTGFHRQAGGPHAEVFALREAGELARGATAYVTLEPCSHFGRTPPCADALVAAGLARVVVAMQDPNPEVAGRGLSRLQAAGIQVQTGLLEAEARALNPAFLHKMEQGRPYIFLKMAVSTDGKVALGNGESQWLTGPEARQDVQFGRGRACAILSTAQTVKTDRALLTVRAEQIPALEQGGLRQPLRIILDRRCRLTGAEPLFQQGGDILLVHAGPEEDWPALEPCQGRLVERVRLGLDVAGQLDICALVDLLSARKLNSIWVEAGSKLATSFWREQLIDELVLYQAPVLLGDGAKPMLELPELTRLSDAPRWHWHHVVQLGADLKMLAYLSGQKTKESC